MYDMRTYAALCYTVHSSHISNVCFCNIPVLMWSNQPTNFARLHTAASLNGPLIWGACAPACSTVHCHLKMTVAATFNYIHSQKLTHLFSVKHNCFHISLSGLAHRGKEKHSFRPWWCTCRWLITDHKVVFSNHVVVRFTFEFSKCFCPK